MGPATNDFDWEQPTALPRALTKAFPSEPHYVDLSAWNSELDIAHDPSFREAIARLAAPIHGKSMEDLCGEDLDQQRRTKRLARAAVAMLVALSVAASVAAAVAYRARNVAVQAKVEAVAAKDQALRERNRALVGLFRDLRVNMGHGLSAGSLCLLTDPRCVRGRKIPGVESSLGTPVVLGLLDPRAWRGVVNDQNRADRKAGAPISSVFVAASESDRGRVVGYAHEGIVRDAASRDCYGRNEEECERAKPNTEPADNLTFVDNALRWVMRAPPHDCSTQRIRVALYEGWVKAPKTQELSDLARRRGWIYESLSESIDAETLGTRLHCASALIWGNPWVISEASLAVVIRYVQEGGGLLLGGVGWSWVGRKKALPDYPGSRLAAVFGFGFTQDEFELDADVRLQPPPL